MYRIFIALICFPSFLFGQNGPGGIEGTGGDSDLLLWLAADKITDVTEGNNVSIWLDASGYGHDATQDIGLARPNWFSDGVNGFPYVRFDAGGEFMEGNLTSGLTGPAAMFTVCYFDSLDQNSDNDWVMSIGSTNLINSSMNIARRRDEGGNHNKYFQYDGTNNNFGPILNGQEWMILTQFQSSSSPFHSMYQDGLVQTVDDFAPSALSTNTDYAVGDWADSPGSSDRIIGKIPEVILFDRELNTAERNILNSYLSAKYDITVTGDQYVGDDPANGDNDRDVIGIGNDIDGSHTESWGAGLQLVENAGFEIGDYVLAGHAVAINTINFVDVASGYDARWDRAFWLDITDASTTTVVDFRFDFSEAGLGSNPEGAMISNYKLVYRAGAAGAWTTIASASSVSGNQVMFNGVSLTSDGYYTIATLDNMLSPLGLNPVATSCKGPGGVEDIDGTSDLKLWLDPFAMRPEDGDELPIFTDFSGYGNSANVVSVAMVPTLNTGVVNGMPVARYNGSNWNEGDLDSPLGSPSTIIGVSYFNNDQGAGDNDYLISVGDPGTLNRHTSISRRKNDTPADADRYYSWDGTAVNFGPVISTATWNIFYQENTTTGGFHNLYIDGAPQSISPYSAAFNATSTTYRVAMWQSGAGSGLDGDIGEVIIFDKLLNTAERNIVTSYLSAKFDIAVTGDQYTGDDPANGDNDLFVVGIGTEADGDNTCANSVGMIMEQSANFGNGDYVMWGINSEPNFVNYSDATDITASLVARWNRDWWVDITDAGGIVETDITFDYSDAGEMGFPDGDAICYFLLYRATESGNWTILQLADAISGDQVVFNDVALEDDGYYTIGTCDPIGSPLPISLLNFDATAIGNSMVKVDWETKSELESDRFVVRRSENGADWEIIGEIAAAGTSTESIWYEFMDEEPYRGLSYYQVVQVDLNGTDHYSEVRSVNIEGVDIVNAYPNPSTDEVTILVSLGGSYNLDLSVSSFLGQIVYAESLGEVKGFKKITIDLDYLHSGTYLLQVRTSDGKYFDQIRVQLK